METNWNYTDLAKAYLKRPDYSPIALEKIFAVANLKNGCSKICDVGAGCAHLTIPLLKKGFLVNAVEPNDEMRKFLFLMLLEFGWLN